MKKYLFCGVMAVASMGVRAEYTSLVFHTQDGDTQSVGLSGLNITFKNGEMMATDSNMASVSIPVTSLKSMEFSNDQSGITAIEAVDIDGQVAVYSVDGVQRGVYESVEAACVSLPAGIYIVKSENGLTSKMMIR